MINKLKEAQLSKQLLEIYSSNNDPDIFNVGYIVYMDDKYYLTFDVSPYGQFDGYSLSLINEVKSILTRTEYLLDIQILMDYYQETNEIKVNNDDLITSIINYLKDNKKIFQIATTDEDYFNLKGYIETIIGRNILFKQVNRIGLEEDGIIVDINDINMLSFDNQETNRLQILYNKKNKFKVII